MYERRLRESIRPRPRTDRVKKVQQEQGVSQSVCYQGLGAAHVDSGSASLGTPMGRERNITVHEPSAANQKPGTQTINPAPDPPEPKQPRRREGCGKKQQSLPDGRNPPVLQFPGLRWPARSGPLRRVRAPCNHRTWKGREGPAAPRCEPRTSESSNCCKDQSRI